MRAEKGSSKRHRYMAGETLVGWPPRPWSPDPMGKNMAFLVFIDGQLQRRLWPDHGGVPASKTAF